MRWAGKIGYARETEIKPGVFDDDITEVDAKGEVKQSTAALRGDGGILPSPSVTTSISVVTDGRRVPLSGMKYVTYSGARWTIASAVLEPPRMVIYLGEEYHGPLP